MISKLIQRLGYTRFIALSFIPVILLGTFLLCLPISSKAGEWTSFLDSLFTSVSATCVTGLVVFDTFTHWTVFGQLVILTMIQIGGLGLMTFITMVSIFLRKKINFRERKMIMQSSGNTQLDGTLKLVKKIIGGTLIFEGIGAVLLAFRFCPEMGIIKGIYYSCFHSISAFCNAGFDLMGFRQPSSSLTYYADDYYVNIIIMSLIVIGGIGFIVWNDILKNKHHFSSYLLHTKIVLTVTAVLLLAGGVGFFIFEYNGELADKTIPQKILNAMFMSVTTRTAGFNTIDLSNLSDSGTMLSLILMLIGGCPGSTAGGLKTTTIAVVAIAVFSMARGRDDINTFKRRIVSDVVKQSAVIILIYLFAVMLSSMIICCADGFSMSQVLFEACSAAGTVGISKGITPELSLLSKIVIMIMMYGGRIGGLSLVILFGRTKPEASVKRPTEQILIG